MSDLYDFLNLNFKLTGCRGKIRVLEDNAMSIFKTDFESLLDPSERGNQVQYQPAIQEAQELRVLEPRVSDYRMRP